MRSKLPSIMALQAFEASARLLSFTEAAHECCLTAGAISRQVRILEAELGIPLFNRQPGGLVLERAGAAYLEEIRAALHTIEQAGLRAGRQARGHAGQFSIATLPGFGARWLMPRYPAFEAQHPDISIKFYTRTDQVDFDEYLFDAAIYFGAEPPGGMQADWLMAEEQVAVCCPSQAHPAAVPVIEALPRYRLLHHMDRPSAWQEWLGELGLRSAHLQQGPAFEQMQLMIEATLSGLGLALLPRFMVEQELATGRLVEPFAHRVSSRCNYWLIYPTANGRLTSLLIFRAWLLSQSGPDAGRVSSSTGGIVSVVNPA